MESEIAKIQLTKQIYKKCATYFRNSMQHKIKV